MERDDFGRRRGIDEVKEESRTAGVIGIGIPALIVVAAAAAYFLMPSSDAQFNQAQTQTTTPPATTQPAPNANPDSKKITPQSEQKLPQTGEQKVQREPRSDSHNAN